MKIAVTFKITIMLMLIMAISVLTGCNKNTTLTKNGDYWIMIEENELCSFSFEYSDYYNLAGPYYELDFSVPFMYVTLLAPKVSANLVVPSGSDAVGTSVADYVPASFEISVSGPSESIYAAKNAREWLESILEDESKWENYQLVSRYPISVAGVEGEFVEYFVDWFAPIPATEGLKLEHRCAIYFDYNGLIWSIEANSRGDYDYNNLKADFDHIIETFKILE